MLRGGKKKRRNEQEAEKREAVGFLKPGVNQLQHRLLLWSRTDQLQLHAND